MRTQHPPLFPKELSMKVIHIVLTIAVVLPALLEAQAQQPSPPPARKATDATTPADMSRNPRQKAFLERSRDKNIRLIFLGDSITDFWSRPSPRGGRNVWEKYYARYDAANFGVSGEETGATLGRIAGGILDGLHPKAVVLMIGTNNIGHHPDEQPEWTAAGIKKAVAAIHEKLPSSRILLLAVFPREGKDSPHRRAVVSINKIIAGLDDGNATRFLDLGKELTDASGEIPPDIMPDGLHPTEKGYEIWARNMQPLLDTLMK